MDSISIHMIAILELHKRSTKLQISAHATGPRQGARPLRVPVETLEDEILDTEQGTQDITGLDHSGIFWDILMSRCLKAETRERIGFDMIRVVWGCDMLWHVVICCDFAISSYEGVLPCHILPCSGLCGKVFTPGFMSLARLRRFW